MVLGIVSLSETTGKETLRTCKAGHYCRNGDMSPPIQPASVVVLARLTICADHNGGFNMQRVLLASAIGASLLGAAAVTLPNQVLAFDMENTTPDTIPGTATPYQDPDEKLQLTAPNESLQMTKGDDSSGASTSSGTAFQLAPGTTLQIGGGTGPTLGLELGIPMGPAVDSSNPADNQKLIPSP